MTAIVEALLLAAGREARAGWRLNLRGQRAVEAIAACHRLRGGGWL